MPKTEQLKYNPCEKIKTHVVEILTLQDKAWSAVSQCETDSFQHTGIKGKPHASNQDQ